MELELFNFQQNSPEWIQARCGLVTVSELKKVMAKGEGKTRRQYLNTVAGERIAGQPFERYNNFDMVRGHLLEDEARNLYSMLTDNDVQHVGFMKRGEVGYSPDGVIGNNGLLELKSKLYHLHVDCLLTNELPSEHKQQCQGGLWLSSREWLDFGSYSPGLPMFVKRIFRDESYIAKIKVEVDDFLDELHGVIERIKQYKRAVA